MNKESRSSAVDDPFSEFLAENPEWWDEVQEVEIPGEGPQLCAPARVILAFINWAVDQGRVRNPAVAPRLARFISLVAEGNIPRSSFGHRDPL